MKEWLLKEEQKAKVGRPKLASEKLKKDSYKMLLCCLIVIVILIMCSVYSLANKSPLELLNYAFGKKLNGIVNNNNGFIVKEYYDDNNNYIMKISPSSKVKSYSGNYKYTTYYLKSNKWVEAETKELEKDENYIKIRFDSLKNQNRTWKVKLQLLNSSGVSESYAPYGWKFVNASKEENKYTYKIFTVKGYYSPIPLSEEKELGKSKDKISVTTKKNEPRKFIINVPEHEYDIESYYTDSNDKKTVIVKKEGLKDRFTFSVSNDSSVIKVTINIYVKDVKDSELKKMLLSNWEIKTNTNTKQDYVANTYLLKPARSYKK